MKFELKIIAKFSFFRWFIAHFCLFVFGPATLFVYNIQRRHRWFLRCNDTMKFVHSFRKMLDSTAESWIYSLLLRISKWIENYFIELEIWDSTAIKRFSLTRSKENRFISTPPHAQQPSVMNNCSKLIAASGIIRNAFALSIKKSVSLFCKLLDFKWLPASFTLSLLCLSIGEKSIFKKECISFSETDNSAVTSRWMNFVYTFLRQ